MLKDDSMLKLQEVVFRSGGEAHCTSEMAGHIEPVFHYGIVSPNHLVYVEG